METNNTNITSTGTEMKIITPVNVSKISNSYNLGTDLTEYLIEGSIEEENHQFRIEFLNKTNDENENDYMNIINHIKENNNVVEMEIMAKVFQDNDSYRFRLDSPVVSVKSLPNYTSQKNKSDEKASENEATDNEGKPSIIKNSIEKVSEIAETVISKVTPSESEDNDEEQEIEEHQEENEAEIVKKTEKPEQVDESEKNADIQEIEIEEIEEVADNEASLSELYDNIKDLDADPDVYKNDLSRFNKQLLELLDSYPHEFPAITKVITLHAKGGRYSFNQFKDMLGLMTNNSKSTNQILLFDVFDSMPSTNKLKESYIRAIKDYREHNSEESLKNHLEILANKLNESVAENND